MNDFKDGGLDPIGGFFELESFINGSSYHNNAIALTTGRACIALILELTKPTRIYIPFYVCNSVIDPIKKSGIEYIFYEINKDLEPKKVPNLSNSELFLCINYFGLKGDYCNKIAATYGEKIIIDDTHNFFNKGRQGAYSFTSARKYFGTPDGSYLYGVSKKCIEKIPRNNNVSILHNIERLEKRYESAYILYKKSESLFDSTIKKISYISEIILNSIDYEHIKEKRIENYKYLQENIGFLNTFSLPYLSEIDAPFCYPFVPEKGIDKQELHQVGLFIPTFWSDVSKRNIDGYEFEKHLSLQMLPLPIDHRYGREEMKRIVEIIKNGSVCSKSGK